MNLIEVGNNLCDEDIEKIENILNLKLPQDYKNFLLKTNGGIPEDEVEFSFIETNLLTNETYNQGSDIHYFYNNDELLSAYNNLTSEKLIQNVYVPIACDSFGNEILMCLENNCNFGSVFFADHESTNPNDSFWSLFKISNSFTEFVNMLKPVEF